MARKKKPARIRRKPHQLEPGIRLAVIAAGGMANLADAIGITPQAITQWTEIPLKRVLAVEKATGVRRGRLRPDLYGKQANGK